MRWGVSSSNQKLMAEAETYKMLTSGEILHSARE